MIGCQQLDPAAVEPLSSMARGPLRLIAIALVVTALTVTTYFDLMRIVCLRYAVWVVASEGARLAAGQPQWTGGAMDPGLEESLRSRLPSCFEDPEMVLQEIPLGRDQRIASMTFRGRLRLLNPILRLISGRGILIEETALHPAATSQPIPMAR